jgi:hypothetical protein
MTIACFAHTYFPSRSQKKSAMMWLASVPSGSRGSQLSRLFCTPYRVINTKKPDATGAPKAVK